MAWAMVPVLVVTAAFWAWVYSDIGGKRADRHKTLDTERPEVV